MLANRIFVNLNVILQVISGLFLGYALYQIRKIITKEDSNMINLNTMTCHICAFGLYLSAAVILQFYYIEYYFDIENKQKEYNAKFAEICCASASFIA